MKLLHIRSISGRNIYHQGPVVRMTLQVLPDHQQRDTQLLLFKRISRVIPGLVSEPADICEIIARLSLYFQRRLNFQPDPFIQWGKDNACDHYYVVCGCAGEYIGQACGKLAVQVCHDLLTAGRCSFVSRLDEIAAHCERHTLGPSTAAIYNAARESGIPVTRLNEGSLLRLGTGNRQKLIQATISGESNYLGVEMVSDKMLTNQLLGNHGIPVPRGVSVRTASEAVAAATRLGYPVVVKPLKGNQGKGVSLNLKDPDEVCAAFDAAAVYGRNILVEKFIGGRQYRILTVKGKIAAAAERLPAHVTGDGRKTISALIREENKNPLRGTGHSKPLSLIPVDDVTMLVLRKHGQDLNYVPAPGERVWLRENDNLSTGGVSIDVTDTVHESLYEICRDIFELTGLDIAGIDLTTPDIAADIHKCGGAVIEVNAAPGIRMHHFPWQGKPRNVAAEIVGSLYPEPEKSKIPVVAVTGTNGKTTVTRMITSIMKKAGHCVGMACSDGVYVGGRLIDRGDTTGPGSAELVLANKFVSAAVLETARGGIIRRGLGYDQADVAVITNVSFDHLGLDGVHSLETLADVKALVVASVKKNGYAVLNADDAFCSRIMSRCTSRVLLFSRDAENSLIKRQLSRDGKAVFIRGNLICLAEGKTITPLMAIDYIPATGDGLLSHNVENALAAIGAAWTAGSTPEEIRDAMSEFDNSDACNPGRFNRYIVDGKQVVLDYGHNPAGFACTLSAVRRMEASRRIGVAGMGGDRPDEAVLAVAKELARTFDLIVIREDDDLRGRAQGELAGLLKSGILNENRNAEVIYIPDEVRALEYALSCTRPGELMVMFYEKLDKVRKFLLNKPVQAGATLQEKASTLLLHAEGPASAV